MRNSLLRTLVISIIFSSSHLIFAEVREHFLIGWVGGKSFLIKSCYPDESGLGFYTQLYLQLYPIKKVGIQLELSKNEVIIRNKIKDFESYFFFDFIYQFPKIKRNLTPFLNFGVGFGGTDMESWEGAQKLGIGFKYCVFHDAESQKIISIPYINLNSGLLYTRVGGETPHRTGVSLYLGIEFGI